MPSFSLNVADIFYSLQGEGPHAGRPAIFVRFSGCNLRCKWGDSYCDTPYASWEPETAMLSLEQLLERVEAIAPECKLVILTGGEPTLQNHLPEVCQALAEAGYELHLETNGLGPIPPQIDCVVCSPKLADSTPMGTVHQEQHELLRRQLHPDLRSGDPRLYWKFVITSASDWDEIQRIVETAGAPKHHVFLMPEGATRQELQKHSEYVAAEAMARGYLFSHRLHILLWDGARAT